MRQVGYIQGVNGCCQLAAAMPAGFLADKYRRDTMLRVGSIIGLAAGLTLAAAVYTEALYLLIVSMALVGVYKVRPGSLQLSYPLDFAGDLQDAC
jgi:MFS family permease